MENHQAAIIEEQNQLFLSGEINFSNVNMLYQQSLAYFKSCSVPFSIDCSRLENSHSATLALLIEWIKLADQLNQPIRFFHLSTKLKALAKSAGINEWFV